MQVEAMTKLRYSIRQDGARMQACVAAARRVGSDGRSGIRYVGWIAAMQGTVGREWLKKARSDGCIKFVNLNKNTIFCLTESKGIYK